MTCWSSTENLGCLMREMVSQPPREKMLPGVGWAVFPQKVERIRQRRRALARWAN
jgi:hypothetical protein